MAVALARRLSEIDPGARFLFVGAEGRLEDRILTPIGYDWIPIQVGGLNRVGFGRFLRTVLELPRSILDSRRILKRFKPNLVIGLGGFSAGPVGLAGRWLKVPLLLIEPNVLPGLTNRILDRWAGGVAVAFEETRRRFGEKARLTGIPIREEFVAIQSPPSREGPLRLLVFGGSQGSKALNDLMVSAAEHLSPGSVRVIHQTGADDLERVRAAYDKVGIGSEVSSYLEDMPSCFERSDLILSRAGALSVAEIAAAGRPSLLVPFPMAADDHQRRNAEALQKAGATVLLEESQIDGRELADQISGLAGDRDKLVSMAEAARAIAQLDGAQRIVELVFEMMSREAVNKGLSPHAGGAGVLV